MFLADDIEVMGRILAIPNPKVSDRLLKFNPHICLCEDGALGLIYLGADEETIKQYKNNPRCRMEAKVILAEALQK